MPSGAKRRVSSAPPPGWRVTPRDVEILRWMGRHGLVTAEQVARRFFARGNGEVGQRAAYDRIRKLTEIGLIERLPTFWKEASVLRVTRPGAQLADVNLSPANVVLAEIRHSLALVDLTEQLLRDYPGSSLLTEREFRGQRHNEIRAGSHRVGRGRIPDGLLLLADGKKVAVELDLTAKRSRNYERIIQSYLSEKVDRIWYYCASPDLAERVNAIVLRERADDLIEVRVWKP